MRNLGKGRCGRGFGRWGIWGILGSIAYEAFQMYINRKSKCESSKGGLELSKKKSEKLLSTPERKEYLVERDRCDFCGKCIEVCKDSAIVVENKKAHILTEKCTSCGVCYQICPLGAIIVRIQKVL